MRAATRSLKLIDADVREDQEANRLFLEILTSKNEAETVLRRMNEAGVLGEFVPRVRPHRGDDAVQHVSSLYGGRASAALHRRAQRDRARRQSAKLRWRAS